MSPSPTLLAVHSKYVHRPETLSSLERDGGFLFQLYPELGIGPGVALAPGLSSEDTEGTGGRGGARWEDECVRRSVVSDSLRPYGL